MRRYFIVFETVLILLVGLVSQGFKLCAADLEQSLIDQVEPLVRQLNDDQASARDAAEHQLLKLAPVENPQLLDAYLLVLPKPIEGMPEEVRLRLGRLRLQLENQQSVDTSQASKLTIETVDMDLEALLEEIETADWQ